MRARSIVLAALLLPLACATSATLVPNERTPAPGVVTGGQPSEAQLRAAADQGYRTVISLRTESEAGAAEGLAQAKALGLTTVSIPVAGAAGVTEENALALSAAMASAQGPMIVHCGSGNRVGALLALEAYYVQGRSVDEALEVGRAAGLTGLESTVRAQLEATTRSSEP